MAYLPDEGFIARNQFASVPEPQCLVWSRRLIKQKLHECCYSKSDKTETVNLMSLAVFPLLVLSYVTVSS